MLSTHAVPNSKPRIENLFIKVLFVLIATVKKDFLGAKILISSYSA